MSVQASQELQQRIAARYRAATWKEKGRILNEFVAATGYGRKYAITRLNRSLDHPAIENRPRSRRRRRRAYDESVQDALVVVWKAANCICSKRLVPFLPEFVAVLERFGHLSLSQEVRERLLVVSVSTVDRLLAQERVTRGRGLSTTKPGQLLKRQIPVRTFNDWNELRAGFVEADLVAHCGNSAAGSFLNTLVLTDLTTGWTECLALLRRSESDVLGALSQARQRLPFPLLGIDTDNGGEFINYEMLRYCQQEQITFTRCRPYKKNDQAHVEEKNGSVVRRLVGYDRYEGVAAWRDLAALYRVLRLYVNFFQPSLKLLSKQRQGARVAKQYDQARTPYQRVLASDAVAEPVQAGLQRFYQQLDPVALLHELERLQDRLWQHAVPPGMAPAITRSAATTPLLGLAPPTASVATLPPTLSPRSPTEATVGKISLDSNLGESAPCQPRRCRRIKTERVPHTWRTRPDPFAEVWRQIHVQLQIDPSQSAKQLFEQLQTQYPERFKAGQLRTLQRRVQQWRREHLYSQEATWDAFYANVVRAEQNGQGTLADVAMQREKALCRPATASLLAVEKVQS